jgi:hypothetical protein
MIMSARTVWDQESIMNVSIERVRDNLIIVNLGGVSVYFSYETPVAFTVRGITYVSENMWSTTTGRHLSVIDGGTADAKRERLTYSAFTAALDSALSHIAIVKAGA